VEPECVESICQQLPPFVSRVGLFVDEKAEVIADLAQRIGLDTLQLHGNETPEFCRGLLPRAVFKAFRIKGSESLALTHAYPDFAWLLDAYAENQQGGTGKSFDWDLARQAVETGHRVILAGGLNPANVGQAVAKVHPYAVDVSSGVESTPGKKSRSKVLEFIKNAQAIEWETRSESA
jgi:phosphoribosylanthranilate isomerase